MSALLALLILGGWLTGGGMAFVAIAHPRRPIERIAGTIFAVGLVGSVIVGVLG